MTWCSEWPIIRFWCPAGGRVLGPAFLSGRMELSYGERVKFYKEAFREEIDGTNDLTFEEASWLVESIKKTRTGQRTV